MELIIFHIAMLGASRNSNCSDSHNRVTVLGREHKSLLGRGIVSVLVWHCIWSCNNG